MTWDRIVSLFPRSTFHDRHSFLTTDIDAVSDVERVACRVAGLQMVQAGSPPSLYNITQGVFTLGRDSAHAWKIDLDIGGNAPVLRISQSNSRILPRNANPLWHKLCHYVAILLRSSRLDFASYVTRRIFTLRCANVTQVSYHLCIVHNWL